MFFLAQVTVMLSLVISHGFSERFSLMFRMLIRINSISMQVLVFLSTALLHSVLAKAHELPDGFIEREIQVTVKRDRILVSYAIAMNRVTLAQELKKLVDEPTDVIEDQWEQFREVIPQVLAEQIALRFAGQSVELIPQRADFTGWSHVHLNCLLAADIELSNTPKNLELRDTNWLETPGDYRIAMKNRSGVRIGKPNVPAMVAKSKRVDLTKLSEQERSAATRAVATLSLVEPSMDSNSTTDESSPSGDLFPAELLTFEPYPNNPIFSGTNSASWDHAIRERGCILKHEGTWQLWYTGYTGERSATKMLGYATSNDGLHWERHSDNPIYDSNWIEDVHVVFRDGAYTMVAESSKGTMRMLTSLDGVAWRDEGEIDVRRRDGTALPSGPCGTPTLWFEDGTWHLFYERADRGIWLATSTDRKVWTNVQDHPVIERGPSDYDRYAIALNQVFRYRDRYYGVYHANADPNWKGPWTTCLATSEDLVHWTKYGSNPLIATDDSSGQYVFDGSQIRLYTMHPAVRVFLPIEPATQELPQHR